MTIERHLVYDPAGGHLARDPDTGHLIRAAIAKIDTSSLSTKQGIDTQSADWPGPYPDETVAMANAVAAMQADSWGSGRSPERYTYKYFDGAYNTQCRARASYYVYDCDAAGVSGQDIIALTVKVTTPNGGSSYNALTYRLKIHIAATNTPYTAWADIYNSPHYTGSANGWVTIPYIGTLDDYLFFYQTADSYSALAQSGAGFNGEDARMADNLIIALDQ